MSVGELVPGYFGEEGLVELRGWVSDKSHLMVPPYEGDEQRALRKVHAEEAEHGGWGWSRDQTRRYYLAGGGSESEFDAAWERRVAEYTQVAEAIDDGKFKTAGGPILYLVAGRRPV
jgi:hypothetical protein